MKRLFILLSSVIICTTKAMDTPPHLPEVLTGSPRAANSDLKIGAQNIYCKVGDQEFRLSDLLDRAIPVVGLQNKDIEKLKRDNLVIGQNVQECLTVVNQNAETITAHADIINEQTKVINQNGGAITTNASIFNNAIKNHAGFIERHEAMLSGTMHEINKASAIYVVAQHPIIKAIASKCYSPEGAGLYLATLLVEGSLNADLVDKPLTLSALMVAALCRTSSAVGISALTSNVINRCGLSAYAQSELSNMATFAVARVASHYLIQLMCNKYLPYIKKEKDSPA